MKKKTEEPIEPIPSQKGELPCSYSLHIRLDYLPQDNGGWVCRASFSDWRLSAIEYGQTKDESIAKAIEAIASTCRTQST
jgi:hypothetical protein